MFQQNSEADSEGCKQKNDEIQQHTRSVVERQAAAPASPT